MKRNGMMAIAPALISIYAVQQFYIGIGAGLLFYLLRRYAKT